MNYFLETSYGWANLIGIAVLLFLIYLALLVLKLLLDRFDLLGSNQKRVNTALHYLLLIYEPVAGLLLASVFVMVSPRMNGLILLLSLILGGGYFKNYIAGRFICRDESFGKGKRIAVNGTEGVIYEPERFGVQIQTKRGRHFVSYSKMAGEGYTILGGEQIGETLHLSLAANNTKNRKNHKEYLADRLASVPYLDRLQKPILEISEEDPDKIQVHLPVRDANQSGDLRRLLNDWGYSCKVLKY